MRYFIAYITVIGAVAVATMAAQVTDTISGTGINTYMEILDFSPCEQYALGDTAGTNLQPGDRVLLIQMKGVFIRTDSTDDYGRITAYNSAGGYEFNTVDSIVADPEDTTRMRVYLVAPPWYIYESGQQRRSQLVRIPQYENVLVDSNGISPPEWDGSIGGVLVFEASGSVILEGEVEANGDGFRGGDRSAEGDFYDLFDYADKDRQKGGVKGEAVFEDDPAQIFAGNDPAACRGARANGGGGGNGLNAGGGGGGNSGRGGKGGMQFSDSGLVDNGGRGGWEFTYGYDDTTVQRIYLGGGGGGGHRNDDGNGISGAQIGEGGAGGGIIIIRAAELHSNGAGISANGLSGDTSYFDGAGGGGAGGVILLDIDTIYAPTNQTVLTLSVVGGVGGAASGTSAQCHGPGGGGGGGFVGLSGVETWETVDSVLAPVLNGGSPGYAVGCTAVSDSTYGARTGYSGERSYRIQLMGYFEN